MSKLIFTRSHNLFLIVHKWHISLNGHEVGSIKNNSETEFEVAPGTYCIEMKCYDTTKLIYAKFIYAKPLVIEVQEGDTITINAEPHPLWIFSHKAKLFSNTESLILIPDGVNYASLIATYEQEKKVVQGQLQRVRFHHLTLAMTLVTSSYLMVTDIVYQKRINEELTMPFLCGAASIVGLLNAQYNKWLLLEGFEWKHQLFLGIFIVFTVFFGLPETGLIFLKNSYFLLAMVHFAISMAMYKRRPVLRLPAVA